MLLLQHNENQNNINKPWGRLSKLLATQQKDILERECKNERYIYMYDVLEYWVAFERSAYQLHQIFPGSSISIFHFKTYPFPVVMASVADKDIQAYFRYHITRTFDADHKILLGKTIQPKQYEQWHREEIDGLI